MQLITVPENKLYMYYKKGRVGDDPRAEERLEEWENVDAAIIEFTRLFEELTGNEFEQWEREKKFEKKSQKFFVVDMVKDLVFTSPRPLRLTEVCTFRGLQSFLHHLPRN